MVTFFGTTLHVGGTCRVHIEPLDEITLCLSPIKGLFVFRHVLCGRHGVVVVGWLVDM